MAFQLPELPYAANALEPHISERTLNFHHGAHHATYIKNLNGLIDGTDLEKKPLLDIVRAVEGQPEKTGVYNNAAQSWNHDFFWKCMRPDGGGEPEGSMKDRISQDIGGYDAFREKFLKAATGQFGSGWAWLIVKNGKLDIVSTSNAIIPIDGQTPLLTCDVWEHAYYLDYQNKRPAFVENFVDNLINWDFVEENLSKA